MVTIVTMLIISVDPSQLAELVCAYLAEVAILVLIG